MKYYLKKIIENSLIFLVKLYQYLISPLFGPNCRFQPTCSAYLLESVEKHGLRTGLKLGFKRISKCHPWGGHGLDLVPDKK